MILLLMAALSGDVTVQEDGGRFVFTHEGVDVAAYHASPSDVPEGVDPMYARSGFLHPVRTPSGRIVTDDHAADYAHQNGVFSTWTKTTFDGREIDFWNRQKGQGTYAHTEVLDTFEAGGRGVLRVRIEHRTLEPAAVALAEERTYRVGVESGATVIDVHSIQRAPGGPLTCEAYHYGGFAVRGARGWNAPATMRTSEGHDRTSGNHTRAAWVSMTGPTDAGPATVAVLSSPANFRAPQTVRLHPEQPYFCFAPCVDGPFTIECGRPLESRYRVIAADGEADAAAIEALAPPTSEP